MFDFNDDYVSTVFSSVDAAMFESEWQEFCDDGDWWRGMDEDFRGVDDPYNDAPSTESAFLDAWWSYADADSLEEIPR